MTTTTKSAARPTQSRATSPGPQGVDSRNAGRGLWLGLLICLVLAVCAAVIAMQFPRRAAILPVAAPTFADVPKPYSAERAMSYLEQICELGPRISGTEGMRQQQELLVDFFRKQNATVELQTFPARHPLTGRTITMANFIASYHPHRPKRFLLAAHYDTRPYPDRDPVNPRGVFIGANDGASGVAALMELSHHLDDLPADVGVDLVLFDGEELVYEEPRDPYFLGSTHFAREYIANPPAIPYQAGIVLDMVADAEQQFFIEKNSWRYAQPIVREVWETAARLGIKSFIPQLRHEIRDDHLPLNQIAKIPTINIIDFDYPRPGQRGRSYWHTQHDIPANCSGNSLAAVVYVVHEWLKTK